MMPDGDAKASYPAYNISLIPGRIRCLHCHPAFSRLIFNFPIVNRFSPGLLP
ncbi:hypothetical protein CSP17_001096 [Salmonella enterica subsp. arizonae]|uniref:Uncharacterized protein n=5 Tax=Salmonella enterica TaxID=28901 RepID=A0A737S8R3_SALER|nr:hypothetical protein [Salmonella enterica subsp. arizonae]EDN5137727.1 hypothetical protein [Salmonella enterica]EDN5650619.1 hypothetical protein [Salmonella enterica subsp. enterica serovar Cerro]EDQ7101624.1 hypothetical protein [Salmonella enterica subsp. houtenae serovar 48:g,z51:-]EDQ9040590.1 hypothetical protein [Salmonella enterica subsp. arizonae serovar [1],13,23:g,z51:-]EDR0930179.1 hypothetical protein [Salmonella enterica subsp. arizonae serovar 18:z4,z23:-]EDR3674684.1 hypot